ncbi:efflux transporter, hydrophobe/amphiphile efflux-3 (HAE3) family [Methanohalobium evestigatum Z-7303]|uniref:Efflux transporter, hydrophobe/amphiphile efflux-3 (HAE3) family n=2 Tax=Methanohalobium evestigatum TaxID=2322 RepID=D7EB83_METEZ|nr:efflux transporter, hydrophobe/amphiphile efflux-3 (HAE3) family [Methanohalobium evestigatum Z-7303]
MISGTETFVEKDSKLYQNYDHLYLNLFSTQSIVVLVEGDDVKTPEVMKSMNRLEKQVDPLSGVVQVTSAASIVEEMNYQKIGKREIPDTKEEINSLLSNTNTGKTLPDDTHALVFVEVEGDISNDELRDILHETEKSVSMTGFPPGYSVTVTGEPAFSLAMEELMNESMPPLMAIAAVLMIIALYLVFRHVRWRLLPLIIVFLGIIYTFGAMGYLEIPMSMVSMSAFPILIGLGIDYAIQFHSRIEEELERLHDEKEAVIETVKHTGPAVLIALIITSLGFVSLYTSTVPMVQDFAKLLLIGVIMCFLSSLFVGVSVIYGLDSIFKKNNKLINAINSKIKYDSNSNSGKNTEEQKNDIIERYIDKVTSFTIKHPVTILLIAGLLCVSGLYVDQDVPLETDTETFVPQDMKALVEMQHLFDIISGNDQLNLIIKVDDNTDPQILKWMDYFSNHEIETRDNIYDSSSIVPIIKSMNSGTIPDSSDKIQELYNQMPDGQKERYIHGNTMLLMNLDMGDAMSNLGLEGIDELVKVVRKDISWTQPPADADVTITGNSVVFTTVITALTSGRIAMTLLGLSLIFAGLLFIYRDWLKAITPVITMFMVVGWAGGVMYYSGIKYTPMTATLGALILGIGSEYAVLMMERYFEEKSKGENPIEAMRESSRKIGKAIVTSGFTTVFGFSALLASPFSMNRNFGLVTVIDVGLALLATFIVFPAVIILLDGHREKKKQKKQNISSSTDNSKEADA